MSNRGEKEIKICSICGKEFEALVSQHRKYCSKECHNKSKQTGHDIICDNCGTVFHRRQYHIDRQIKKEQNNFCCLQCQKEYLHKQRFEIRECEICGNQFEVSKLSSQRFCSVECQKKWQSTIVKELNPNFKSILIECSYCGKMHYVKPYKFNEQEHFFCSVECRQAWYAEIYSQTDEYREQSRQRVLEQLKDGKFGINTEPQKRVNDLLDLLKIDYIREESFEFFAVDNYLPLYNLIIEVQGDYWHANPIVFPDKLNETQCERIYRDKAKHSYLKNKYNIDILYLWEHDIIHNIHLCELLIKEYVNNCGKLMNYNSFNYIIQDEILQLNSEIIIPYQDMPSEQYKQKLNIIS